MGRMSRETVTYGPYTKRSFARILPAQNRQSPTVIDKLATLISCDKMRLFSAPGHWFFDLDKPAYYGSRFRAEGQSARIQADRLPLGSFESDPEAFAHIPITVDTSRLLARIQQLSDGHKSQKSKREGVFTAVPTFPYHPPKEVI